MEKIAIIGASYLQEPLIRKAKELGLETHVFAWACGDIGERIADFFYPISIVEKDAILRECRKIDVSGVCTIASDLANTTATYVAHHLGLTCNSLECLASSTDKHRMRICFEENGDPSPKSKLVSDSFDLETSGFDFPIIVKPADRSGSRGIYLLDSPDEFDAAVASAREESFSKNVLVEEFAQGREYSIEHMSWKGEHYFLAITEKFTTGSPRFVETGHLEPARIPHEIKRSAIEVVEHALDSLGVEVGASHAEIKIDEMGGIKIIEIASRMGGDFIGSDLVHLSTGYDFCKAIIEVALGKEPDKPPHSSAANRAAAVRFVLSNKDIAALEQAKATNPDIVIRSDVRNFNESEVIDSSARHGYYLMAAEEMTELLPHLPLEG